MTSTTHFEMAAKKYLEVLESPLSSEQDKQGARIDIINLGKGVDNLQHEQSIQRKAPRG